MTAPGEETGGGAFEAERKAFAAALLDLLSNRQAIRAGRVQVLKFNAARERLGADWPKFSGRVQEMARIEIKRHLGPQDCYLEIDDCCFLIVFADLDSDQARLQVAAMLQHVLVRLFGEEAASDVRFRSMIGADARAVELDRETLGHPGGVLAGLVDSVGAGAPPLPAPPAAVPAEDTDFGRYFADLPGGDHAALPADLTWRFRPLWHVPRHALSIYFCEIESACSAEGRQIDLDWVFSRQDDQRIGHLDAQTLAHVGRELYAIAGRQQRCLLACSLHYHTLDSKQRRQAYLQQFQHLPEDHPRHLLLEICGLPGGIPLGRAREFVAALRLHARLIVLRQDLSDPASRRLGPGSMAFWQEAGVDAVGFDARQLRCTETVLFKLMDSFAAACESAGLRSSVLGLSSRSQTLAAVAAGFDVIHSEAIRPGLTTPGQMFRYGVEDLFSGLLAV